jgi:hypothetical protein
LSKQKEGKPTRLVCARGPVPVDETRELAHAGDDLFGQPLAGGVYLPWLDVDGDDYCVRHASDRLCAPESLVRTMPGSQRRCQHSNGQTCPSAAGTNG